MRAFPRRPQRRARVAAGARCVRAVVGQRGLFDGPAGGLRRGLPIVATDVGGNGEIVRDDMTGRLVPAADPPAWPTACSACCTQSAARRALGSAARAWVEQHGSLEAMATRYAQLYLATGGGHEILVLTNLFPTPWDPRVARSIASSSSGWDERTTWMSSPPSISANAWRWRNGRSERAGRQRDHFVFVLSAGIGRFAQCVLLAVAADVAARPPAARRALRRAAGQLGVSRCGRRVPGWRAGSAFPMWSRCTAAISTCRPTRCAARRSVRR
jgi:hypothetical protein